MIKEDKVLADAMSIISKKYGASSLMDLTKQNKIDVVTVSTGLPSLDYILGGGIPRGRIIEIFGQEATGKSSLALQIIAQCQKEIPDKKVVYLDLENAFDPKYAEKLGVDLKKLYINQANSGEESLDIIEKLAGTGAFSVMVLDSVSNLVPQAVAAKEIDGTANIGTTARLLSQNLPRINNAISRSGTILIFINQIRCKIGVLWGSPFTTSGGMALKFNASQRIELFGHKAEERKGKEGIPIKIKIKKNKIAPPFRETEVFLIFGEGFDVFSDLIETAIVKGIIQKSGSWYVFEGIKSHGIEEIQEALIKDKKLLRKMESLCKTS